MKPSLRPGSIRLTVLGQAAAALLCLSTALPVAAQWAWRDDAGRIVYSDRPPPASVRKEQIVRQPAGNALAAPATAPAAAPATAPAVAPAATAPRTMAEQEQAFRKRQQERADAEKKQAEEQALAARRKQDCDRARGYLRQLEDGIRIARVDAQGNQVILDEAQRSAEMVRARELIAGACK